MYLCTCRRERYSCLLPSCLFCWKEADFYRSTHSPGPSFADALLNVPLKLVQLLRSELNLQSLEYQLLLTGTALLVFCLAENFNQSENLYLIFKPCTSSTTDAVLWNIHFFPMLPATHQMFKAVAELGTVDSSCRFVQCRYEVQKSVKHDLSCLRTPKAKFDQNHHS